jgi:hypothetical protein
MAIMKKDDRCNLFLYTVFSHNVIVANNCLITDRSSRGRRQTYTASAIHSTFKDENESQMSLKSQTVPHSEHTPSQLQKSVNTVQDKNHICSGI